MSTSSTPYYPSSSSSLHSSHSYLQQDTPSSRAFRHNEPPTSLPIRPYLQRPTSLDRDNDVNISRHSHIPELQFNSVSFEEDPTERNTSSALSTVQQTLPCSTMHHILEEESVTPNEQQRMSHEMVEYLVPPSRYSALSRANTDPSSTTYPHRRTTPVSPPPAYGLPAYEEVVKEVCTRRPKLGVCLQIISEIYILISSDIYMFSYSSHVLHHQVMKKLSHPERVAFVWIPDPFHMRNEVQEDHTPHLLPLSAHKEHYTEEMK